MHLLSSTVEDLQNQLNIVYSYLHQFKMKMRPSKCTIATNQNETEYIEARGLKLGEEVIPNIMNKDQIMKILGVNITLNGNHQFLWKEIKQWTKVQLDMLKQKPITGIIAREIINSVIIPMLSSIRWPIKFYPKNTSPKAKQHREVKTRKVQVTCLRRYLHSRPWHSADHFNTIGYWRIYLRPERSSVIEMIRLRLVLSVIEVGHSFIDMIFRLQICFHLNRRYRVLRNNNDKSKFYWGWNDVSSMRLIGVFETSHDEPAAYLEW